MKPAELRVIKRKPAKRKGRGAPVGNSRAMKHGVFSAFSQRNLDGRTAIAKTLQATRELLVNALGGKPTPKQSIIIERAVYKSFRCGLFETAHLNGTGDDHSAASDQYYLAWSNSLRLDLAALGLDGIPGESSNADRPLIRVEMVSAKDGERPSAAARESDDVEPGESPLVRVEMIPARTKDEPPRDQQTPPRPQSQPSREPEWTESEPEPSDRNAIDRTASERKQFIPIATWGVS